ncbi:MAG TPA: DUF882 domain-containing protein [Burkholderiales bacterium]|nr:DUF882 domain-containing protein [Burkholderiales bacterium]
MPFAIALSRAGLANASEPRALAFHHLHTGERLSVVYFAEGEYVSESLERIDWLLRDFRTGDVCTIAPDLLDTLHALQRVCGASAFEVICGYRSPQTNAMLRNTGGGGVAEHSLHLQGRAIDVRVNGLDTACLRQAAISLQRGGVGYYPKSNFIHLDTGRVRSWGQAA